MSMKQHILAALREELEQWEALLASLSEIQITTPNTPSVWSCKDVIAHLRAWQQRSNARFEAALQNREPVFPKWPAELDPESEGDTDPVNAWIYESAREQPWPEVYRNWKEGFLHLLESAEQISERDLLDPSKYPWMQDIPLVLVLVGTYDHHQEHLEKQQAWLQEHGINSAG
jgi:hypothetical protein